MKELIQIQSELKVPKANTNNFGKYKYRSCEDILEAVKPIVKKHNCILTLSDDVELIGNFLVNRSTAKIASGDSSVSVSALAGIDPSKKGMDLSQCFGSSSSYARKRALSGLFLIDDSRDADSSSGAPDIKSTPSLDKPKKLMTDSAFSDALKRYKNGQEDIWDKAASKGYTLTEDQKAQIKAA